MADKEYKIKLVLDVSQSLQASRAQVTEAEKVERAAKKAADAQEREARRAADAQAREAARAASAAERERIKEERLAERAARTKEREARKAAEAEIREQNRAVEAADKARARDEQAAERSRRREEEREKRSWTQRLNDAQVAKAVQNRLTQETNDSRIKAALEAAKAEKMGFAESTAGALGLDSAVAGLAGKFTAVAAAGVAIKVLTQSFIDARQKALEFGDATLRVRDQLKDLAVLRGAAFSDDKTLNETLALTRATGMTVQEADEFQKQVLGSGQAGLDKGNTDQDTLGKAMVITGTAAARQTKDMRTRGDLVGMLASTKKYGAGADAARKIAGDAEAVRLGLTEGRGDDAPLTRSLLNVAGSLVRDGGMVGTMPELASLIGVTSMTAGPGMADTRTEQLVRGLRGSNPKQMDFLKSLGVQENMNLEQRLAKVMPALRAQRGAGRDLQTYLIENNMNEEQARALVELEPNYELLTQRFARQRGADFGAKVEADNETFKKSKIGRFRVAEAGVEAAKIEQGLGAEEDVIGRKEAEGRLIGSGWDTDPLSGAKEWILNKTRLGGKSGRDVMIDYEAQGRGFWTGLGGDILDVTNPFMSSPLVGPSQKDVSPDMLRVLAKIEANTAATARPQVQPPLDGKPTPWNPRP